MADISAENAWPNVVRRASYKAKDVAPPPILIHEAITVGTTFAAGTDKVVLLNAVQFKLGVWLSQAQVALTDLDTDGTPAHVCKLVTRTADGTETDLQTSITSGQAGGTTELTAANVPLNLTGKSLVLVTSTAADVAAAGTVTFTAVAHFGKLAGEWTHT